MNATLIQQLANGEIAVVNDGTLEELRQVLKEAFPLDQTITIGSFLFYESLRVRTWIGFDISTLPTVSIKQFFNHE